VTVSDERVEPHSTFSSPATLIHGQKQQ
jgi:hypothetical protein